ncbi:MAG: hypothetical protein JRI68_03335 [Deltaproteobacteria bacterium]|nr:hypothetical protein [Deltaproteobacteria bacterium]
MGVARIPFSAMDESRIASAASWGIITAVTSLVSIAITAVVTLPQMFELMGSPFLGPIVTAGLVATLVVFVVTALLDVWLIQASMAFRKVALTDVADQHYLIEGFAKLRNYFLVLGIMLILAALFMVGGLFMTCAA